MSKINKVLLFINFFFLQAYLIRFKIGPLPSNLQEILIGLNSATFLITIIKEKRLTKTISNIKRHWVILGFAALTTLSVLLIKPENILDFYRHLKFLLFALIITYIFIESFNEKERIKAITIGGFGAITFGVFSVIYNLLGYNETFDNRLIGPLDAAVYMAYYLVPFFIFFSWKFIENPKNKSALFAAILLGFFILATRSMGAIGGSFIVLTLLIIRRWGAIILKKKAVKWALALAGMTIVVGIFYTKVLPTFNTTYSSLDERGEIWRTSIHILKEPKNLLLGVGFGQFENHYIENVKTAINNNPLDYYVLQPHNIFLLFIFQYGILGLLFLFFIIYKTFETICFGKSTQLKTIAGLIVLYFIIHGLIDTPFFKNDIMILLVLFLEIGLVKNSDSAKI